MSEMQDSPDQGDQPPPGSSRDTNLVCSLCQRTFGKESTFKRHGYYCRSRPLHQRKSRKRACSACVQAKVRCDSQSPSCSRCSLKGATCVYHGFSTTGKIPESTVIGPRPQDIQIITDSLGPVQDNSGLTESNSLTTLGAETDSANADFDWDRLNELELLPLQPREADIMNNNWDTRLTVPTVRLFSSGPYHQPHHFPNFDSFGLSPSTSFLSIPPSPPSTHLMRSFTPKPLLKSGSQSSAMILIQILKSYPKMMTRKETFPPFIHASCISDPESSEDKMPEALSHCMVVANLFYGDIGGRKLLWNIIKMEQERLTQEHPKMNQWDLLAAVQALMIYMLMRLIEGPTENTNFDVPLLTTILVLARAIMKRIHDCLAEDIHPSPLHTYTWRDWVFHESRRRTLNIFRLLSILFELSPAAVCATAPGFLLMPLPASKLLWEAPNSSAWRSEVETGTKSNGIFGLMADGQLMRLERSSRSEMDDQMIQNPVDWPRRDYSNEVWKAGENWTDWAAGMDGYGYLIMIAASLVDVFGH